MGWIILFIVLALLFGWSLFSALALIVKVLLFVAAIVILVKIIKGERVL